MGALFRIGGESLLSTLFPAECRLCEQPLLSVARLPVCDDCLSKIQSHTSHVCERCGESVASDAIELCAACRNAPPPFVTAKSIGTYDGTLRGLIHLLKYQAVRPAASTLARQLRTVIERNREQIGDRPLIVPVPLHRNKFRARGFNQAEEIAQSLRKLTGFEMRHSLIHRRRDTISQTGMTAHQRRENVRAAFFVKPHHKRDLSARNVILVDDVMTTGATAAECTRVLLRAGAKQVFVLTAARVTAQSAVMKAAAGAQG